MDDLSPTPQFELKPQLVWLGKFLGMDVYMDIHGTNQKSKHAELARRIFKSKLEEMN